MSDATTTFAIPPAQDQTSVADEDLLTSANAGVVVERTAQLKNGFHAEGRQFARGLAELINTKMQGTATVFVYEETFGIKDKMHFFIHLSSLAAYEVMVAMGSKDDEYRAQLSPAEQEKAASWDKIFVDGGLQETVLLPQFWGMYGTKVDGEKERDSDVYKDEKPVVGIPGAREQVALPIEQILHSGNSGIVMHRTAQLEYDYRSEGRQFAREVAESINENLPGEATVFVYEEAFGTADRLHWLIHLKSITSYYRLLELHVRNEQVRELYFQEKIAPERGGGTWAKMFVPGSMVDVALTPQHWGMYAT
ncbi:hypothetical protein SAMN05443575_1773 [Jatrophihabitans endophyticus]|uniref:Uncharacterized protein n=1 Tax=Jatrophihabitans endophyticus TaxID=1206085 RepID=A0A1M5I6C1_9ACTN|nr:DUF6039 family protein [Jatrophihabitans endophyticus]SHG23894.1 hypothetical protein SAMN05443575_1773 [Jatrophihabitans endophyticus]